MKGDFSTWRSDPTDDHLGVLYQQGRLISDADLTEGEILALLWRVTAGRDIIGANVAAVPGEHPDGYRVLSAAVDGSSVLVGIHPGRIWADGLHLVLQPDPNNPGSPVVRRAHYMPPPHNPAGTSTADIAGGTRDAVILEVSLEALNGFQDPARLVEPALGGPDTAERVIPRTAIRLLRLGDNENCATIGARSRDDLGSHGRLTVSLEPATVVPGNCPIVEGRGYSGFEHNLYRIEIAETDGGPARFKWSQFNGGLVGRGRFHGGADPHVDITANRAAILNLDTSEFYLEALEFNEEEGHWQVAYGTPAARNAGDELDLADPPTFGAMPGAGDPVFFRLWNGIREIGDFVDVAAPVELRDGIRLVFDPPGGATYRPGSWWNFDVRAGEISNPNPLIDDRPPEGPLIRRVPLAEITWSARRDTQLGGVIEDCRRHFRPLTNQRICCTYVVGNGVTTFGDFNSLEEAAANLPSTGGRLCLLPGVHFANLTLNEGRGVQIHGCRHRTFVLPRMASFDQPILSVRGGRDIAIRDLDLIAPFGIAVDLASSLKKPLSEVSVSGCRIMALTHGIHVETVSDLRILSNQIWLLDHPHGVSTISIRANDALIERNRAGVWPFEYKPPKDGGGGETEPPDPAGPCIEPDDLYANLTAVVAYAINAWSSIYTTPPTQPYRARGGIHVKGGSERVDIRRNRINGGLGHGITLGGVFRDETQPATPAGTAPDGSAEPEPTVNASGAVVFVEVIDGAGAPQPGATVTLLASGSKVFRRGIADEQGRLGMGAVDGVYRITVGPALEIRSISRSMIGAVHVYTVVVGADDVELSPDEGFLTRIRILDNQIERMGLSGIGFWFHSIEPPEPLSSPGTTVDELAEFLSMVLAPREFMSTTNLVRDLVIRRNRIENNLQVVFTDLLRTAALFAAQGGVSLALVEGLRIEDNHITGNCPSAVNPCAGIFVGYGKEVQISGNYIAGNGPVGELYREGRSDGLRSGIFIRLASAVIAGGTEDGQQKPALVIRDNTVDQPAGRAITAFAYGPVTCVGNTLNSEHEGAWALIDGLVGGVLIVNLGGIHRLQESADLVGDFNELGEFDSAGLMKMARVPATNYRQRVETMLPGGETLFNSNRVRTGPGNRSWTSQIIATVDDLGFDGNQSSVFRPDVTFANMIGVAHSLRVTNNRFRERAYYTAMSALTFTGGTTISSGARALNMTSQNQGDHCIIAMTAGTIPVEDRLNQVVHHEPCPIDREVGGTAKRDYVLAALFLAWRFSVDPNIGAGDGKLAVGAGLKHSLDRLNQLQVDSQLDYATEYKRLEKVYGEEHPLTQDVRKGVADRQAGSTAIEVQRELVEIRETVPPATPAEGVLLDGRVADSNGRGADGLLVELVTADDRLLGPTATTNKFGYYALEMDDGTRGKLFGQGEVFLRVTDAEGNTVSREAKKLDLEGVTLVRTDLEVTSRFGFSLKPNTGETVFTRDETAELPGVKGKPKTKTGGQGVEKSPSTGGKGGASVSVPLEQIQGVGTKTAARLRAEGVQDAEALAALPEQQLTAVVGKAAPVIRKNARVAIEKARTERKDKK